MSFSRGKMPKTITFTCDGCSSEFLETEEFDLADAVKYARRMNWATVSVSDDWLHHCPDCARRLGTA